MDLFGLFAKCCLGLQVFLLVLFNKGIVFPAAFVDLIRCILEPFPYSRLFYRPEQDLFPSILHGISEVS